LALREADIALRNFRPEDPDLVARKLSDHHAYLYATPEYLSSLGSPTDAGRTVARRVHRLRSQ
jgi:DNA-binding transcriptional LysR family regulator